MVEEWVIRIWWFLLGAFMALLVPDLLRFGLFVRRIVIAARAINARARKTFRDP